MNPIMRRDPTYVYEIACGLQRVPQLLGRPLPCPSPSSYLCKAIAVPLNSAASCVGSLLITVSERGISRFQNWDHLNALTTVPLRPRTRPVCIYVVVPQARSLQTLWPLMNYPEVSDCVVRKCRPIKLSLHNHWLLQFSHHNLVAESQAYTITPQAGTTDCICNSIKGATPRQLSPGCVCALEVHPRSL